MLRQSVIATMNAYEGAAAPTKAPLGVEPGFSREGPIAIATPTGRLRGESSGYASVWDGGFRAPRTTAPAGWPHDFSGASGREARVLCCSWRGLTRPWPRGLAALCFRAVRGARRVAPMGRLACWRVCGALVGQTTLVRGPERCPVWRTNHVSTASVADCRGAARSRRGTEAL